MPFSVDDGFGPRARIGLVVLEGDQTVEAELSSLWPVGVAAFATRIPMEDRVTAETLRAMEERIPTAAKLLPTGFGFDVIGYGCTSAATLIGEARVDAAIRRAHPEIPNTNPITAAVAAFGALGATRIGVVTPYNAEVTRGIIDHLSGQGLEVIRSGSFLEESDHTVARITEASVAAGVRQIAGTPGSLEAVFVSCTSLRLFGIANSLEDELGIPVVTSNLVFGWHLLRLAGIDDHLPGFGSLFEHNLNGVLS